MRAACIVISIFLDGYSICLRIKQLAWNKRKIFQTDKKLIQLYLYEYSSGIGKYYNGMFFHYFDWRSSMPFSFTDWNSMCLIYATANLSVQVVINGQTIINEVESYSQEGVIFYQNFTHIFEPRLFSISFKFHK